MKVLDSITLREDEKQKLQLLAGALHSTQQKKETPKLVGPDGSEIELPESVFEALSQVISYMLKGKVVSIIPVNKEITTQEAADFLNVSRPFLVGLLEQGVIPFVKVGSHRRIRFSDVLAYKKRQSEISEKALIELTHLAEDAGFYE